MCSNNFYKFRNIMSTIDIRKIVTTKYRIRLRPTNLPVLSLTFSTIEEAKEWIEEHEQKYIENPEVYQQWIKQNRESMKKNGIFHNHISLSHQLSRPPST